MDKPDSSHLKHRLWMFVCGLVVALEAIAISAEQIKQGTNERYIRYGFTLQNEMDKTMLESELWVCAPIETTSSQRLMDLDASQPYELITDQLGNHLLRFVFSNIPPYAVRIVNVEATLTLHNQSHFEEAKASTFLRSESLFPYDHEAFDRLVPEFPKGATEETVRAIFDWVRHHVQDIGYDGTDRGALYALTEQKGDCTEFAALFVALCRRADIPARLMGGYVVTRNTLLNPASYHNWAEVVLDGQWRLTDPQRGVFDDQYELYVATRILGTSATPLGDFSRFRFLGDGIRVRMNE